MGNILARPGFSANWVLFGAIVMIAGACNVMEMRWGKIEIKNSKR
jgi:hypothetical protein